MVSSDLGACEWFVWDLRRSGLIDRGQLDQVVGEFLKRNPRAEPPALAEYLIGQNVLSPFQAERILQGKTQGLVLGPYVLLDGIGAGSMGQVYKASSKTDSQGYAVKVLPRRSMWNVRLARRQVRAFSQFNHPAVVPFVDVGTSGGQHYLVWPLVEGETLEARVQREGKLAPETTAQIGVQLAQGLAVCHQNGLFHGLLKPSNVMIGGDGQARLLDFGIGSLLVENEGESLVDTMSTANTLTSGLDCSSPESIMEPTNRTPAGDQYSLGCILYFCLAGRYPFADGTAVEKMMAHQFKQPTPLRDLVPGLPEGLIAVVERLMQKSPDGRFTGCDEVVDALQPFAVPQHRPNAFPTPAAAGWQREYAPRAAGGSQHGTVSVGSVHTTPVQMPPAAPPVLRAALPPAAPPLSATPYPGISRSQIGLSQLPPANSRSGGFLAPPLPPAQPTAPAPAPVIARSSFGPTTPAPHDPVPHAPPGAPTRPHGPERSEEELRTPLLKPLMIIMGMALVVAAVWFLGKNFLFPPSN